MSEEAKAEIEKVLEAAPTLKRSFGKVIGGLLMWKALSVLRPRRTIQAIILSICSAVAAVSWRHWMS